MSGGGTLATTARTGVKDETNAVVNTPLPGFLADLCGVQVDEYDVLPADVNVPLALDLTSFEGETGPAHARLWCDMLMPTTAQIVGRYQELPDGPGPYYAGRAAVTLNHLGQGRAVYIGTMGNAALQQTIVDWLIDTTSVSPVLNTPDDVEAVERWRGGVHLLFLLNHADESRDVTLFQPMTDLLTGTVIEGQTKLEPKAVLILHEM